MQVYHERLRVPHSWWLIGLGAVAVLGTELAAGFSWLIIALIYALLASFIAAMLASWGRAAVEVRAGELRAGGRRLPLGSAGQVIALDEPQTRAVRGPRADPAAFLLIRPYLHRAVYVEVADAAGGAPYWLLGTRHPAELALAIEQSRPAPRADGAAVG